MLTLICWHLHFFTRKNRRQLRSFHQSWTRFDIVEKQGFSSKDKLIQKATHLPTYENHMTLQMFASKQNFNKNE